MFAFKLDVNKFAQAKREAQWTRSFDFVGISLLEKPLIPKRKPSSVLFSAMLFRAVFRSPTVLKTPAIFFLLATQSRSKLRAIHIAWKRLIGSPCVPLFINQSESSVLLPFFCTEFPYFCTELLHFCIEFAKNCISLSPSDARTFFMYIIIQDNPVSVISTDIKGAAVIRIQKKKCKSIFISKK